MGGFLIGRLAVGRERHLAVQEITRRTKSFAGARRRGGCRDYQGRGLTNRKVRVPVRCLFATDGDHPGLAVGVLDPSQKVSSL